MTVAVLTLPRERFRHPSVRRRVRREVVAAPVASPATREDDREIDLLVDRARTADRAAFAELYEQFFDQVYAYLRTTTRGDAHAAEDLTQQVFLRVFEAIPRYERRKQPFRAWLFTIARNAAVDNIAQRTRTSPVEPASPTLEPKGSVDNRLGGWLADEELLAMIARLPLTQRQVVVLRFGLELSGREVAQVLGITPEAVRAMQTRAMRFMRERLRPDAAAD
jgi:RNA polymerase sigma-70 factor (ECF subfamily)